MRNKPLIFSVLSLLCLIEPMIKVLYFKAMTGFDFALIFSNIQARNTFLEVVDFWLIFPLAGVLILKLRKWTYFAFMGVLAYINYKIFTYERYTWPYNSETPFVYNYVMALVAIAVFVYFLSPKVRATFFDRRVRWWDTKERYEVRFSCKLQGQNLTFPTEILNISQSGAFVLDSRYIHLGDKLQLEFNFLGQVIQLPVEVMNKRVSGSLIGYGLEFKFDSYQQGRMMKKIVSVIKRSQNDLSEIEEGGRAA